jgi:hypothetical protein
MDFYLRPPDDRGLTLSSVMEKGGRIGPEWDGYEVFFDDKDNPDSWWNRLFRWRNTDADPDNTAKKMVSPPPFVAGPRTRNDSVVIGLFGLDCRHECHSELHPAYAMAIHTQASGTYDRWSVFARNWGNEGSCGSLQREVQMQSFSMRLQHPFGTAVTFAGPQYFVGRSGRYDTGTTLVSPPTWSWNMPLTVVNAGTPDAAVILTIALPPPEARVVVLAEVALNWTELSPELRLAPNIGATKYASPPSRPGISSRPAISSRDDEHIERLIRQMTPAQRTVFLANAPKPKLAVDKLPGPNHAVSQLPPPIPPNPHLVPVRVQDFRKIVRPSPDPVRDQQIHQFNQAICTAYKGKLPGLPEACSKIMKTSAPGRRTEHELVPVRP